MFEAFNAALAGIVGKYVAVIGIIDGPLLIGITFYLTLIGFFVLAGKIELPVPRRGETTYFG